MHPLAQQDEGGDVPAASTTGAMLMVLALLGASALFLRRPSAAG